MTANNSTTTNNIVFCFVSDLKIVYYNNNFSLITMPWTRKEKIFFFSTFGRQDHSKLPQTKCNHNMIMIYY